MTTTADSPPPRRRPPVPSLRAPSGRSTRSTSRQPSPSAPRSKQSTRHGRPQRGRRLPVRKELSAGGVVARREGEQWMVALLKTEHKRGVVWVLPKGHVELDTRERVSDAARREVEEEAGLTDLSVRNQLGVTRFTFQVENAVVHKTVHYFLMTSNQRRLVPQEEEGLIEAAWFPIDEAIQKLEYDTDQDIVSRARDRLLGHTRSGQRRDRRTGVQPRGLSRRTPPGSKPRFDGRSDQQVDVRKRRLTGGDRRPGTTRIHT